jgi:CxxC-x17-CxxC domain-containing protein
MIMGFRDRDSGFGGSRSSGGFNRGGSRGGFGGGRGGSRGGFRDRDSGGFGERRRPEMHDVICDKCKKDCQVPFKPTGDKPVLCSECFRQDGGESTRQIRTGGSGMSPDQFKQLNTKLDKILGILETIEFEELPEEGDEEDSEGDLEEESDEEEKAAGKSELSDSEEVVEEKA